MFRTNELSKGASKFGKSIIGEISPEERAYVIKTSPDLVSALSCPSLYNVS